MTPSKIHTKIIPALRNPNNTPVIPIPIKHPKHSPKNEYGNKISSILKTEYNPL